MYTEMNHTRPHLFNENCSRRYNIVIMRNVTVTIYLVFEFCSILVFICFIFPVVILKPSTYVRTDESPKIATCQSFGPVLQMMCFFQDNPTRVAKTSTQLSRILNSQYCLCVLLSAKTLWYRSLDYSNIIVSCFRYKAFQTSYSYFQCLLVVINIII